MGSEENFEVSFPKRSQYFSFTRNKIYQTNYFSFSGNFWVFSTLVNLI